MKLVIIFGPQAVGKMTVGQELEKLTGLKLFHNHMTIELVSQFFDYGSPAGKRLVGLFREEIFEEVAKSDLPGLIFTYVWAFDLPADGEYIEHISRIFEAQGGEVYYVELEADLEERLIRNRDPHRLLHKPTKRNVARSEKRPPSNPGEISTELFGRRNTETELYQDQQYHLPTGRGGPNDSGAVSAIMD